MVDIFVWQFFLSECPFSVKQFMQAGICLLFFWFDVNLWFNFISNRIAQGKNDYFQYLCKLFHI